MSAVCLVDWFLLFFKHNFGLKMQGTYELWTWTGTSEFRKLRRTSRKKHKEIGIEEKKIQGFTVTCMLKIGQSIILGSKVRIMLIILHLKIYCTVFVELKTILKKEQYLNYFMFFLDDPISKLLKTFDVTYVFYSSFGVTSNVFSNFVTYVFYSSFGVHLQMFFSILKLDHPKET